MIRHADIYTRRRGSVPRQAVSVVLALVLLYAGLAAMCLGGLPVSGPEHHGAQAGPLTDVTNMAPARFGDAQRQLQAHLESISNGRASGVDHVESSALVPTRGEECAHPELVHRDRSPVRTAAADLQVGRPYIAARHAPEVQSLTPARTRATAPVTLSIVQLSISRT